MRRQFPFLARIASVVPRLTIRNSLAEPDLDLQIRELVHDGLPRSVMKSGT
jgi:hypothetical protein